MAKANRFETREAASAAAAARMAGLINNQCQRDGAASVVVSGGTTPGQCLSLLAGYELPWENVEVALSDERWVPSDHDDSNEGMVRRTLLVDQAENARLLPVYQPDTTADERCDSLQENLPANGFACSLVGMGTDGHFASLFPDADVLEAGLDLAGGRYYLPVRTAASPHPRVSMSLHALTLSTEILLLFFGDEKLRILEEAIRGDSDLPVASLLAQSRSPVALYWAP